MAKFVCGLNQSLDGFIDHDGMAPSAALFRHFIEEVRSLGGSVYGRRMYVTMRYWDDEHPEWSPTEREYAEAWRRQHKWVVSRTLQSVGPNATLVANDLEATMREVKAAHAGEFEIAGPALAQSLAQFGLIDEYRLYLHPVTLGRGKPFFAAPPPPLRLESFERMDDAVIRLSYAPI
ncbi:MAG: dihydrofolate reductase family protein [Hyphomonadaceae bacterium]